MIARQLFPGKDPDALSETEKQQVSALSQLAAGIAGGLATGDAAGGVTGAQAGRNAVENNNLSAPQLDEFAERARGCGARGDCHQVIEEMERLSVAQQDRLISVCATDPNACRKEYGDIPANSMLVRDAIDRVLGDSDIPWQMRADMGPLLSQQIDAEGVVSSTEFAERLARTYGIDKDRAELLSGAVLGAITGGVGKGGKSPAKSHSVHGKAGEDHKGNVRYQPNKDAVGKAAEFLEQPGFGSEIKDASRKTSQHYHGQAVYQADRRIGNNIRKGDKFYLDGTHMDHIEVFDKHGNFRYVLNLDGSVNDRKTRAARGRSLK
ncbi:VENN motif pre-toxin domain-containing protein [Achromobacter xylosoxidans]